MGEGITTKANSMIKAYLSTVAQEAIASLAAQLGLIGVTIQAFIAENNTTYGVYF